MKLHIAFCLISVAGLTACGSGAANTDLEADSGLKGLCEAAVASEANVASTQASAISTIATEDGTLTTVLLEGAAEAWNCRADSLGIITGIEYSAEG